MSKIRNIERAKHNASKLEYHEVIGIQECDVLDVLLYVKQSPDYDHESAHKVADHAILSLIRSEAVRDAYDDIGKWYS